MKGKLRFISFWHPINLETKDGHVDLRVQIFGTFNSLNGKKANMIYGMNNITILADEDSEYELEFENKSGEIELGKNDTLSMILRKSGGQWGMSNIGSYLPDILQRLNSMQVIVEVDENSISFKHDETEEVYKINYTQNNSCQIPDDDVKKICKIGEDDCCIFCSAGGNGFMCQKFNSNMASILLDRHIEGTMRASRIGNCMIVGRIES
jgi:hypothetical protein